MRGNTVARTGGANVKDKTREERVAELEQRVAELSEAVKNGTAEKDWRSTVGKFSGDEDGGRRPRSPCAAPVREPERLSKSFRTPRRELAEVRVRGRAQR
jgi:hypothetical protein